jgi:hypothetical protein
VRATVSKVMLAYANHGRTTSAKRKSGRKSTFTERDRLSNNHSTAAQLTPKLNMY